MRVEEEKKPGCKFDNKVLSVLRIQKVTNVRHAIGKASKTSLDIISKLSREKFLRMNLRK